MAAPAGGANTGATFSASCHVQTRLGLGAVCQPLPVPTWHSGNCGAASAYLTNLEACADVLKIPNAPIFPEGQAQAVASFIMADPNSVKKLEDYKDAFGTQWMRAFKELSAKDCLPVGAQIVVSGLPGEDGKDLMEALKDKDFEKDFYELANKTDFTKADFEGELNSQLADYTKTLLAGGDQPFAVELKNAVRLLAMQYMNRQGLNYMAAIKKAANTVIFDKYSFPKVNGQSFRVPKAFDKNAVEAGAGIVLMHLAGDASELSTVEMPNLGERGVQLYKNYVARNGCWVTNEDESGAYLFVGRNVVRDKKGNPVMRSWQEFLDADKKRRVKAMEADVRSLEQGIY